MQERISRFNRLLKIREDNRRAEQAILAEERHEETEVLNRLSSLEGEKAVAIREFQGTGERLLSGMELWTQRRFIEAIDTNITKGKISLNDVRTRISKTEARLVERHKDVRIMETYIGHLKEDDFKEQLAIEQNELDDVANVQFARVQMQQRQSRRFTR